MTLERLAELKLQYQKESDYFRGIHFEHLATKFGNVVNILAEIEEDMRANVPVAAQEEARHE